MSEDVFRIVITVAVGLACMAFLVQAGVAIALFNVARKMQKKTSPLIEKAEVVVAKAGPVIDQFGPLVKKAGPVIDKAGPAVEKVTAILTTTHQILDDTRPRINEISTEAVAIVKSGRQQVEHIGSLLHDAGERAKARLEQIEESVENTVGQVEQVGENVKNAVLKPVREVNGIAAGISAVVSTLVRGSRRSSVDHATQDEEMFI